MVACLHPFSTKQMHADDDRDKPSQKAGYATKRSPNPWVDLDVDKFAVNIAILVNRRQHELRERRSKITVTDIMKSVGNYRRNWAIFSKPKTTEI